MFKAASIARANLAKHDHFRVGVYLETDSYGVSASNVGHNNSRLSLCAEMMALAQCKMLGLTPIHLHVTSDSSKPVFPCGVCRQYASEFPKLKVTSYNNDGTKKVTKTIAQLFPNPFTRK